jgi:DNA-directed RNA polymerase specialized sigma subunit
MTAKEYLSQAYHIDKRINSKLAQVQSLRALVTGITSVLSDVPSSGTWNMHKLDEIIARIVDTETEINEAVDELVDKKCEIALTISTLPDAVQQTILDLRYLCFKPWNEIATELGYGISNVYRIHDLALAKVGEKL